MDRLSLKIEGDISHGGFVSFKQKHKKIKEPPQFSSVALLFLSIHWLFDMYDKYCFTFSSFSHRAYFSVVKRSEIHRLSDSMHLQWPELSE